jgi:hypothetical protein
MIERKWREVGPVIRLQIQLGPLKTGDNPRVYNPISVLQPVAEFQVSKEGVVARIDGRRVLDVHHKHHPQTRNRELNPVSFGLTSYYRQMQQRFGAHLSHAVAGENILVETAELLREDDLTKGVAFRGADGTLTCIENVYAMAPCEPFTRFCLSDIHAEPALVKETLQFLANGTRGFSGEIDNETVHSIRLGDILLVAV